MDYTELPRTVVLRGGRFLVMLPIGFVWGLWFPFNYLIWGWKRTKCSYLHHRYHTKNGPYGAQIECCSRCGLEVELFAMTVLD